MLQELEELTCIIHKCLVINENLAVGMINSSISILLLLGGGVPRKGGGGRRKEFLRVMINRYYFTYHLPPYGVLLLPGGGERTLVKEIREAVSEANRDILIGYLHC